MRTFCKKNKFRLNTSGLSGEGLYKIVARNILKIPESRTKIVAIVGGAASGKTTFAKRLVQIVGSADVLSTDDFLIGDRAYRRQHFEGHNPLKKYDIEFLNRTIQKIKSLKTDEFILVPFYDETSGVALSQNKQDYQHKIGKINVLLIEGDFFFVRHPDYVIYYHVPDNYLHPPGEIALHAFFL